MGINIDTFTPGTHITYLPLPWVYAVALCQPVWKSVRYQYKHNFDWALGQQKLNELLSSIPDLNYSDCISLKKLLCTNPEKKGGFGVVYTTQLYDKRVAVKVTDIGCQFSSDGEEQVCWNILILNFTNAPSWSSKMNIKWPSKWVIIP